MNVIARAPSADIADDLRQAMRYAAGTVSVITAGIGEDRNGLTATSATSLSLEPPTMILCVNQNASALPVILNAKHFCVNLLTAEQRDLADRFAGRYGTKGVARYDDADWTPLETGAMALDNAVANIDCELEECLERHGHTILLGRVRAVRVTGGDSLLYGHGRYSVFQDD